MVYVLRYRFEGRVGWTVHAREDVVSAEELFREHARDLARLPGRADHESLEVEVTDAAGRRCLSGRFYVDEPLTMAGDHSIGAAETADPDLLAALPPEKAEELRARLRPVEAAPREEKRGAPDARDLELRNVLASLNFRLTGRGIPQPWTLEGWWAGWKLDLLIRLSWPDPQYSGGMRSATYSIVEHEWRNSAGLAGAANQLVRCVNSYAVQAGG